MRIKPLMDASRIVPRRRAIARALLLKSLPFLMLGWSSLMLNAGTPAAPQSPKRYSVAEHGAVGDGRTSNTAAIQSLIDQCAAEGGGVLVVPGGTFITGAIFLKPGVNLHLEKDAVLKGSQNTNDYPWIDTRIAGFEMKWPAALVNADNVTGLQLTGEGTIDGSGSRWWEEYWRTRAAETDGDDPHFKVARPRLVHIINSRDILVRDLLLKDSAFWHLQITYCDGVEIHNLKVRAPREPVKAASSDGIDIDSSRNVLITGADIECEDDAICLKSGRDADGLRVNRPTENVVIRDSRVGNAHGMVVFGSETSGGIRNVKISNMKADEGCQMLVRFKTRMGRGGVIENILYENIESDGALRVINFDMDAMSRMWIPEEFRTPVPDEIGTPVIRNVTIRNVTARGATSAGRITGLPQSPLQDIVLENVHIEAGQPFVFRHARGLQFINVTLNGAPVSAPPGN